MANLKLSNMWILGLATLIGLAIMAQMSEFVSSRLTRMGTLTFTVTIAWYLARTIRRFLATTYVNPNGKSVLITGCDSGFGHKLARKLDLQGYKVYAACLFPEGEGAQELKRTSSSRLKVLHMDVTDAGHVAQAVETIKKDTNQLWALVNNAGILKVAPVEWGEDLSVFTQTMDINVMGVVRVTKAFLPMVRAARGRVVVLCSRASHVSLECYAAYCMSKHAVRSFCDTLRREMFSFGVKVIAIEPWYYRTALINDATLMAATKRELESTPEDVKKAYERYQRWNLKASLNASTTLARSNPDEVVAELNEAVTNEDPLLVYRPGGFWDRLLISLGSFVSVEVQDVVSVVMKRLIIILMKFSDLLVWLLSNEALHEQRISLMAALGTVLTAIALLLILWSAALLVSLLFFLTLFTFVAVLLPVLLTIIGLHGLGHFMLRALLRHFCANPFEPTRDIITMTSTTSTTTTTLDTVQRNTQYDDSNFDPVKCQRTNQLID